MMHTTRRSFLKQATLAGVGMSVATDVLAFHGSPNEKIVVGMMGTNSRGFALTRMFAKLPNVEVACVCDVDSDVVAKTVAEVQKVAGNKPKGFDDIRKMLEVADLDAVVIAAPDHWHAPAALMAVQAGKHVYVEKPCSHNPAEGEMLVAAAANYRKLIQMGNQRRSFPNVIAAMKDLRDGIIGRVYFAKGWYANDRESIGRGRQVPVPSNLNYELWQGPAPREAYRDNIIHYNWHWFWNWGTGEALNNGTHEIDVMRWGLDVTYPIKVSSGGGRFAFQDDWQTPDTQVITFEFPNNTAMTWEGRSCNNYGVEGTGRGVIFYGEKGTMVIPGGDDYKVYSLGKKELIKESAKPVQEADRTNTMGMGERLDSLHLANFVESIRGKQTLNSPILEGQRSTLLPQLGNIAYRTGHTLMCDPANGHILNDDEATKLWSREYADGWTIRV